ncbi:hypothetical protein [Paenibacillus roseipurpureus]|uniref:Heparinase II/III-like protein n=1 Tax=Paenibacillus roseopurpureus TaxID=2918901 RepID=A0AA96LSD8_9BACL|nr:hypothetical protein [Paenibacillus sp. MBLB1832]WNR45671.1 hypothetical protein MJB10_06105 [Paenibacillus sp. MBLB1832]
MPSDALLKAIQLNEQRYNDEVKLVRTPLEATYHTALKPATHPFVYALYPSMSYAYDLLTLGGDANAQRAAEILGVIVTHQDQDPSRATYGIWPYFYDESLDEMDRPDWNMADFHGKKLVLILKKYAAQLPDTLVRDIREAVYHACQAIILRNVGPHYTNIALMGAFVTLVGGEILGDEEIRSYGEKRLKRFLDYTTGIGTFTEYNSPCYSPLAIEELDSVYQESTTPGAVADAEQLLDIAWHMIAKHYHPATREWSGPYSRTYHTRMTEREKDFLGNALKPDSGGIQCAERYHSYFSSKEERYYTEPTMMASETGYQNYATTYQNDKLSLGSYTSGSMWNQRRNLLGFVDAGGKKVSIQLQFLKDGRDFCSAIFTGVQSRNQVLFSFNLATDNGAWHQDLDIINGRFQAKDLRIRLLLGGELEGLDLPAKQEGRRITAQLGDTQLQVEAVLDSSDYGPLVLAIERSAEELHLDYVISSGNEERAFDFHKLQQAVWVFAFSLGNDVPLPTVHLSQQGESVTASADTEEGAMSITVPVAPGLTADFYRGNHVRLPQALQKQLVQ